jgi:RimJ/RimL family protein N-acetyltransferase
VTATFRPLAEADLGLLHAWLSRPHVTEWWGPAPSFDEVRDEYLPSLAPMDLSPLDALTGVKHFLAWEGDVPFAFAQAYRVMAHQADGWWTSETDPCALGIDQFIGLPERLGQGYGTALIRAFAALLFEDPRVTGIQADPSPDNPRAIAAYRKAGFRDTGVVGTPDGPALLMRIRRGEGGGSVGS